MKLPKDYISNYRKGFTLVEVLLVLSIIILLITLTIPLGIRFYSTRQLDVSENGIVQTLRRAQIKAMSMERDSAFGVYITSEEYVLFKGDSYIARDISYDEIFDLPDNLSITGLSEIVFSKLKGTPSDTGTITLFLDNRTESININEMGMISF